MDILQTIWSALTTPHEMLVKLIGIPLVFLDAYIGMLFFTTILNIDVSKKRKIAYVLIYGIFGNILTFTVPATYKLFINLVIWPILIFFILKPGLIKTLLSVVTTLVFTSILNSVFANIFLIILNKSPQDVVTIPLYRTIIVLCIYLFMFLLTKFIRYFKININVFENLSKKSKILLITSALLVLIVLCIQFVLLIFYSSSMPAIVSIINILVLIIYFTISIVSIINISKLEITKRDLESTQRHLHSLSLLHDTVRAFKHDFNNIVNSIGGYVVNEDMEGLKKYYNQLLEECNRTNNLAALSPSVINHPAIYYILATKYYEADKENVQINLKVFLDLNEIETRMKIYDFTRILGILLDNAIDAAKECDQKLIDVTFRKEVSNDMITVIIKNTYNNKDVDTEEIYQKGVSTKKNHTGLGLWKVRQILMHNNNLNLFTTKDDEFFTQQFEIYK